MENLLSNSRLNPKMELLIKKNRVCVGCTCDVTGDHVQDLRYRDIVIFVKCKLQ